MSLFPVADLMSRRELNTLIAKCGACGLLDKCQSPKMSVDGRGEKKVLIVGEAPGRQEDEQGKPFVGDAGQCLSEVLGECDVDLRTDCYIYNALSCRPPNNAKPTIKQIDACRPRVFDIIESLKPDVIITLGGVALRSIMARWVRTEENFSVNKWQGFQIPLQPLNCWICPNWHPSYIIRNPKDVVLKLLFKKNFQAAFDLEGKPWTKVPSYKDQVEVVYKPDLVAKALRKFQRNKMPVAFDYETNMLKPDRKQAQIVCCAVSDGELTISYPWMQEAIAATGELLQDPGVPKYGWNTAFEGRWTKKKLGHWVAGWTWDGMENTHLIDNRKGITSVKFQAMTNLGLPPWNEHIEPYLKARGGNTENRIKQVNLDDLLTYCGVDALVEFLIARKQMDYLKIGG